MKVAIIGIWHLGIINCVGFAEKGINIIGIDFDANKVNDLNLGQAPLYEPGLNDLLKKHLNKNLYFTNDISTISDVDCVIIAYDTPINEKDEVDISIILQAIEKSAPYLNSATPVIVTSQVPLGTCENIQNKIYEINPHWKSGVVYTPENLRLGTAISRFLQPDMLVFGSNIKETQNPITELYKDFETTKIFTDLRSAEMVKHALNAFLATSITFINEIANLSDRLGADAVIVGQALKLDSRIGKSALMMPGLGFSGGTLARDVVQLRKFSNQLKYDAKLLDSIISINDGTFDEILIKLQSRLGTLNNKSIGILGLTYKPGTSTMRQSSAIKIIQKLHDAGAKCFGFDPKADNAETQEYDKLFTRVDSVEELAKNSDALVLITEWTEFKELDFVTLAKIMKTPIMIDSKNYLCPDILTEAGFDYQGFGRSKNK